MKELDSNNLESKINWVCQECWEEWSRETWKKRNPRKPQPKIQFDLSTWHDNTCDVCWEKKSVTQPRDFFYPDFNLLKNKLWQKHKKK